jgi:predicted Zn-dependent protease
MRPSELKAKLQEAITLAQAGQRTEARRLLNEVVEADPTQELAWMWLASVSTDREERIQFLERALTLNPDNPTTQQAYAQLTGHPFEPPPPSTSESRRPAWSKSLGREAPISL